MIGEIQAHQTQTLKPGLIVHLGRYVNERGELSVSDINRLKTTAALAKSLRAYRIVTSGGGLAAMINPGLSEAVKGRQHLVGQGLDASKIYPEAISPHTWGNAIFTRLMIESHLSLRHLRSFVVVSSNWHDQRVLPIFEHVYGDDYDISFLGAHDPPSAADLQGEISGVEVMNQIIANTPRGDLEAIRQYVDEVIPPLAPAVMPLAA